jgi:hypothetical protein
VRQSVFFKKFYQMPRINAWVQAQIPVPRRRRQHGVQYLLKQTESADLLKLFSTFGNLLWRRHFLLSFYGILKFFGLPLKITVNIVPDGWVSCVPGAGFSQVRPAHAPEPLVTLAYDQVCIWACMTSPTTLLKVHSKCVFKINFCLLFKVQDITEKIFHKANFFRSLSGSEL